MITTVLAFLLTLGVLIVIHEYGHYRVAVACGVRVLRFSVGFGRVIWRYQRSPDSTEFVLSALPLGGYVRMLDEREGPVDARDASQAFNRKPLRQRAAIVAAGPAANLLLAVVLYAAAHWIGVQEPRAVLSQPAAGSLAEKAGLQAGDVVTAWSRDGTEWRDVASLNDLRWQVTQAALNAERLVLMVGAGGGSGQRVVGLDLQDLDAQAVDAELNRRIGIGPAYSPPVIGKLNPGGPAERAGLAPEDRVLRIDGQAVPDAAWLRERIYASGSDGTVDPIAFEVERKGARLTLEVTPRLVRDGERTGGRIDAYVGGAPETVLVRHGLVQGLTEGATKTWEVSALTVQMLGRMLIGEASLQNLSGPLTIADFAGQSVERGLAYYLGFLALVSVSLGVLNLLPLPMLDGGHLMYYLFEAVTGRPVSEQWLLWLQRGGAFVLLLLMSLALSNDLVRLLGQH